MRDPEFESLLCQLTEPLQSRLRTIAAEITPRVREIRIRVRKPVCIVLDDGVRFLGSAGGCRSLPNGAFCLDPVEFEALFQKLCGYSVHSASPSIRTGFLTLPGGHRVGVGGKAVLQNETMSAVREIGFLSIRVAREKPGCADGLAAETQSGTRSLILAGPPCSGKTTLLRDLARLLGSERCGYKKVIVCDERGELAAVCGGVQQFNVGINTDVLTGYPKQTAIEIATRSFSPDYIILDEVAAQEEAGKIAQAVNCSVRFALSLHADSAASLRKKQPLIRLLETGEFPTVLLLAARPPGAVAARFDAQALLD